MTSPQNPREPSIPDNYDVSNIESPAQRVIREGYAELTALNRLVIDNFDPNSPVSAYTAIELETKYTNVEDEEPKVAEAMRTDMLRNLGLSFAILSDGDQNKLFQHKFDEEDGITRQIRLINRGDGVMIPVYTELMGESDGNAIDRIALLPASFADGYVKALEGALIPSVSIESPAQQILKEEFKTMATWNRAALLEFDPTKPGSFVDIRITTGFTEAEEAEPKIAEAGCANMLSEIGLAFEWLGAKDPSKLFQEEYNNGEIDQLRLVTRWDGVKIPVYFGLSGDEEGNALERIRLLSNDVADEYRKKLEDNIDEQKVDLRLQKEFGLDEEFIHQALLTYDDKRSMLSSYDAISALEAAKPDTKELDKLRSRFVKGMLPASNFLEQMRDKRLAKTQVEYEKGVVELINRYELKGVSVRELLDSERLQRLVGLNEQLNKRVFAHKVGLVAMTGTAVSVSSLGGALIGEIHSLKGNPIVHAIVGSGLGLAFGIQEGIHLRKNIRDVHAGFLPISTSDRGDKFTEQLAQEKKLAWRYSFKLGRK